MKTTAAGKQIDQPKENPKLKVWIVSSLLVLSVGTLFGALAGYGFVPESGTSGGAAFMGFSLLSFGATLGIGRGILSLFLNSRSKGKKLSKFSKKYRRIKIEAPEKHIACKIILLAGLFLGACALSMVICNSLPGLSSFSFKTGLEILGHSLWIMLSFALGITCLSTSVKYLKKDKTD